MKKLLVGLLASALLCAAVVSCGSDEEKTSKKKTDENQTVEASDDEKNGAETPDENQQEPVDQEIDNDSDADSDNAVVNTNYYKLEKLGSTEKTSLSTTVDGFAFKAENGKYGIGSLDGDIVVEPTYAECEVFMKNYYQVSVNGLQEDKSPAGVNVFGVVDNNGDVVIPLEYVMIESTAGKRYAIAHKATAITENEDESFIFISSNMFSLSAGEGDIMYKTDWCVYDLYTGEKVENVGGSGRSNASFYGECLLYADENGNGVLLNAAGDVVEFDRVYEEGYYTISDEDKTNVYAPNGEKLFDYTDEYRISSFDDGYWVVYNDDDGYEYYILDENGNEVSAKFEKQPYIRGKFVEVDKKLYDFEGNELLTGSYSSITDSKFTDCVVAENDNKYTFVDENGSIMNEFTEDDEVDVYSSGFVAIKKVDGDEYYFNFAEGDFMINGMFTGVAFVVERRNDDDTRDLIDTRTGETLLSGYSNYSVISYEDYLQAIVIAQKDGVKDFYRLSLAE